MPTAWRVVKKKHQQNAFSGEGARLFGGRWNSPGQAVIYCAETLSGALLEILVHGNRQLLSHYIVYRLKFPQRVVSHVKIDQLPKQWRSSPPPNVLAEIGDDWYLHQRSAVLQVPSAVVPLENNYLLNPGHRDYRLVEIEGPIDYQVDGRLL